jgi:protocatechuate 3,4-dioxygenase beta subunit
LLAKHPSLTRASLVPPGEAGEPLVVTGVVRDADGHPLAGAHLHLFQTDTTGQYTPTEPMDEPHARLFAYIVTAEDGRFELTTIRPGGYPGTPEHSGLEWRIPSHIHFEVAHTGHAERRFQLVFDDDPRMQPEYWREWAKKGGQPVVKVTRDATNVAHAELEIVLGKV